ncbi:MAG: hypothetical protein NWE99_10980 [Candidatus Bathyarchaeota archaeon]|nr:hypothetical protein [Candidatus Bathyarchaeota archaeon]
MSSVDVPKVVVVFGTVNPPQEDVVDLRVHLGATREVSSFECTLENWNKKYSPSGTSPINVGVTGGIGIARGATPPENVPVISLRVEKVEYRSGPYGENYCVVSGRCWGEKLFRRTVTKSWINVKAEAVVKDLLDNYVGLSHNRSGIELVEDTATTYTKLEYMDTPVWDILEYVAGSSVAPGTGVVGYDFRVAPDGKFEFFPRGSKTSSVSLSGKIERAEYRKDVSRVRNKIVVYGVADKSVPSDKDAWTESLSPSDGAWTATAGTVSFDTSQKKFGAGSIKLYVQNNYYGGALFTLNSGKEVDAEAYPLLSFWLYRYQHFNGHLQVDLFDVANKTATHNATVAHEAWFQIQVAAGSKSGDVWSVESGFDWTRIKKVRFTLYFDSTGTSTFWIDGLYFGGKRYSAMREDSASQNAYGLRELVEVDEELPNDNACDLRAQALLAYFKDPAEYITLSSDAVDYGTSPILAGDRIYVSLPNENVAAYFRVDSVEYAVSGEAQALEITLELGRVPPRLTDYMYGLRATTVTVEKLARTKLGKGGVVGSSVSGAGVTPNVIAGKMTVLGSVPNMTSIDIIKTIWEWVSGIWTPMSKTFPTPESYLQFKDTNTNNYFNFQQIMTAPPDNNPLVVTDQGCIFKKDLAVGGFLSSQQGAVGLGSGLEWQLSPPRIWLAHSGHKIITFLGDSFPPSPQTGWRAIQPLSNGNLYEWNGSSWVKIADAGSFTDAGIKFGSSLPGSGQTGELFIRTSDWHLFQYSGGWVDKGHIDNYAGYFDTLYIQKANLFDLGNLCCQTVTAGNHIPLSNNTYDLGSSSVAWHDIFSAYAHIGDVTVYQALWADTIYGLTNVDLNIQPYSGRKVKVTGTFRADTYENLPPAAAHASTHHSGGSDPLSLGSIAGQIGYGQTTFANQNLLTTSDALFNSVKGSSSSGALKAGNEFTVAWDATNVYVMSHFKHLYLGTPSGKDVYVQNDLNLGGNLKGFGYTLINTSRVLANVTADASIITSGVFGIDRIPTIPCSKTDFCNQNLFTTSDAIFNSVKGTNPVALKAGDELSIGWEGSAYTYIMSHWKTLCLISTYDIAFYAGVGYTYRFMGGRHVLPEQANSGQVGNSSTYWYAMYSNWYYGKNNGLFGCERDKSDQIIFRNQTYETALDFLTHEITKDWRHTKYGKNGIVCVCGREGQDPCPEHEAEWRDRYVLDTGRMVQETAFLVCEHAAEIQKLKFRIEQLEEKSGDAKLG